MAPLLNGLGTYNFPIFEVISLHCTVESGRPGGALTGGGVDRWERGLTGLLSFSHLQVFGGGGAGEAAESRRGPPPPRTGLGPGPRT